MSIAHWRLKNRYYRLIGSRCEACGTEYFPPVYRCRHCSSDRIVDKEMPRTGRIKTFTVLRETMVGFEDQEPLLLGIIELENGVKVLSQIVDATTDQVKIGDQVRAVFRRVRTGGDSGQIHYAYKFVKA